LDANGKTIELEETRNGGGVIFMPKQEPAKLPQPGETVAQCFGAVIGGAISGRLESPVVCD
jgi:hypothetical protein